MDEEDEEVALDADLTGRAVDAYEAEFMQGQGRVFFRDKTLAPRLHHLMLGLPAMTSAAMAGGSLMTEPGLSAALPLFAVAGLLSSAWMLFSVLRVTVSAKQLEVQYGLFGPTIAIDDIEEITVGPYDWKRFGGWGIRRSFDGTMAYNMMGDGGRAVTITYRRGSRLKKVLIASKQAELLYDALRRARRAAAEGGELEGALHEEVARRPGAAPEELPEEHELEVAADEDEGRV